MASWNELRRYILDNFKVDNDDGSMLRLIFEVGDGSRSQLVLIGHISNDNTGEEWVGISSPIAPVGNVNLEEAARRAFVALCGGIVVIADVVYLHHAAPLVNLDTNEFIRPLSIVVEQADQIESALTGGDRY